MNRVPEATDNPKSDNCPHHCISASQLFYVAVDCSRLWGCRGTRVQQFGQRRASEAYLQPSIERYVYLNGRL
jgi:hypothetical protein